MAHGALAVATVKLENEICPWPHHPATRVEERLHRGLRK